MITKYFLLKEMSSPRDSTLNILKEMEYIWNIPVSDMKQELRVFLSTNCA
jgi:hypothetical protein